MNKIQALKRTMAAKKFSSLGTMGERAKTADLKTKRSETPNRGE